MGKRGRAEGKVERERERTRWKRDGEGGENRTEKVKKVG